MTPVIQKTKFKKKKSQGRNPTLASQPEFEVVGRGVMIAKAKKESFTSFK